MRKGSITVEAACLFPIIILVIIYLMEFALYMHDQVVIQAILNEGVVKEAMAIKQPSNYETGEISYEDVTRRSLLYTVIGSHESEEEALKRYVKEQIESRVIVSSVNQISVSTSGGKCKIQVTASADGNRVIEQTAVSTLHNPSDFVRRWDNALEVIGQIDGLLDWGKKE